MIFDDKMRDEMAAELTKQVGTKTMLDMTRPGHIDIKFLRDEGKMAFQEATALLSQKKSTEALNLLRKAVAAFVGKIFLDESMPLATRRTGVKCAKYMELGRNIQDGTWLVCLCGMIGKCFMQQERKADALEWFQEVHIVRENLKYSSCPEPMHEWIFFHPQMQEYHNLLVSVHSDQTAIYLSLGNSALALYHAYQGLKVVDQAGSTMDQDQMMQYYTVDLKTVCKLEHPDPVIMASIDITERSLQIRGSWEKVRLPKTSSMPPRQMFTSFILDGHLYVLGGQGSNVRIRFRDFWRINLKKLDKWEELPSIPKSMLSPHLFIEACQYNNRVYVYTGNKNVCVFDFASQSWSLAKTKGTHKYPQNDVNTNFSECVVARGKMYVFGGQYDISPVGCNLLHALDLTTMEWECLSGDVVADKASWDVPGPRRYNTMWASKDEETIFVMFGDASRQNAKLKNHKFRANDAQEYADLWSFNIARRTWKKELITGNFPCPRTEMAATYNPALKHTVVFGGYSPTMDSPKAVKGVMFNFTFSYFADTFLLEDPIPSNPYPPWKHVLTRGFPSYRAQAKLQSDPDTGNTYLYGGYINSLYAPNRKSAITHSHSDLWRLKLDVEGGGFEDVDWVDESRTARAGPWQRCFSCGKTGQWKKCGGSCGGVAHFCNAECLKAGWSEHKEKHGCKKV